MQKQDETRKAMQEKLKLIAKTNLPKEVKQAGTLGVAMGVDNDSLIKGMVAVGDQLESKKAAKAYPKMKSTPKYTILQKKIADLLTEDTGVAMMDSGGEGGRAWQQNRNIKDFRERQPVTVETYADEQDYSRDEVIMYRDVFHFLEDRLEITPESKALEKKFEKYQKANPDSYNLADMEEFAEQENDEGADKSFTVNTYNGEDSLTQVLQYTVFTKNDRTFVLLQVHGGADVRGGYTTPQVFEIDEPYSLMNSSDFNASDEHGNSWYTDDAYNWYTDLVNESQKSLVEGKEKEKGRFPGSWIIKKDGVYSRFGGKVEFS